MNAPNRLHHDEFLEGAIEDLAEAQRYYDDQTALNPDLPSPNDRLYKDFNRILNELLESWATYRIVHPKGVRQCSLRHFPYHVVYTVQANVLVVIALRRFEMNPRFS